MKQERWTAEQYQRYGRTGKEPTREEDEIRKSARNAKHARSAKGGASLETGASLTEPPAYLDLDVVVGVDPGTTTGFALWLPKNPKGSRFVRTFDASFVEAMKLILTGGIASKIAVDDSTVIGQAVFVVEDNRDDPVYRAKRDAVRGMPLGAKLNMARRIGMADAYTAATIEAITSIPGTPYSVMAIPSPKKSGIFPVSKWDQATFERVTGSTENTNQHKRDAARIACAAYPELILL